MVLSVYQDHVGSRGPGWNSFNPLAPVFGGEGEGAEKKFLYDQVKI